MINRSSDLRKKSTGYKSILKTSMLTTSLSAGQSVDFMTFEATGGGVIECIKGSVTGSVRFVVIIDDVEVYNTAYTTVRYTLGSDTDILSNSKRYTGVEICRGYEFKNKFKIQVTNVSSNTIPASTLAMTSVVSVKE